MFDSENQSTHLSSYTFFSEDDFHLRLLERKPQVPYPLHTHDFHELVIVTSGTGIHFSCSAEYQVFPGDVFVIEAGYAHGYRDTKDLQLYNIIFDKKLLSQMFFDIKEMPGYHAIFNIEPRYRDSHEFNSRLRLGSADLTYMIERIDMVKEELDRQHHGSGNKALALAYFIEIVVYLSRRYTQTEIPDSSMIMRLAGAFTCIEQNSDRTVTIDELCSIAHMSHSSLNRAFHKAAGCSPIEYQLRLRIERSCRLLRTTGYSITRISELTGFSDSNYFSRQFRRIMQASPREYKKAYRDRINRPISSQ
ncbi:MAG: AraC family transcriptional regulator [Spirochaetia bacterium]|nr:AraC family transcriptional regulator [Spirochaetia bacterium]MCF7940334.1 AraC family transcriptional regulator [Spirochaetia bacterium]